MELKDFSKRTKAYFKSPEKGMNHFQGNQKRFIAEFADKIGEKLELSFFIDIEDGNVCFADNNDELQDDYKHSFTLADVLNFISAILSSKWKEQAEQAIKEEEAEEFPYPEKKDSFWKMVELGNSKRVRK